MKKFIISILFVLLFAGAGFAQFGQGGGGITGITFDGNGIVIGSPADSLIIEIPTSIEASILVEMLIGTSFKIFNTAKDSMIFNPNGFKASNSEVGGIYVFQYGSAGGDTARIDSNAVTYSSGGFTDGTFTVDGSGNFTGVAAFTSTGAFTSPGIDDNADDIAITIDVTTEEVNFSGLIDGNGTSPTVNNTLTDTLEVVGEVSATTFSGTGSGAKIIDETNKNDFVVFASAISGAGNIPGGLSNMGYGITFSRPTDGVINIARIFVMETQDLGFVARSNYNFYSNGFLIAKFCEGGDVNFGFSQSTEH